MLLDKSKKKAEKQIQSEKKSVFILFVLATVTVFLVPIKLLHAKAHHIDEPYWALKNANEKEEQAKVICCKQFAIRGVAVSACDCVREGFLDDIHLFS